MKANQSNAIENRRSKIEDRKWRVGNRLFCSSIFALLTSAAAAQTGGGYDLTWSTIDSGGEMFSTGNGYELGGTIGQADAGELTGDNGYALTGGFWAAAESGVPCTCQLYGDVVAQFCLVDVDDLLCVLDDFVNSTFCPGDGDIFPCGGGDDIYDVDDISAVLAAFTEFYFCPHPCPP